MFYTRFNFNDVLTAQEFAQRLNNSNPMRFAVVEIDCTWFAHRNAFAFSITIDQDEMTQRKQTSEEVADGILETIEKHINSQYAEATNDY